LGREKIEEKMGESESIEKERDLKMCFGERKVGPVGLFPPV
jgi:hypothetical protein